MLFIATRLNRCHAFGNYIRCVADALSNLDPDNGFPGKTFLFLNGAIDSDQHKISLGNILREMYEAAAIDGGGRWAQFRHVTLPLLSPTIYFLTLYSVIGTFKAFNHIYVLRTGAALGTPDTASVVIFQTFKRDTRYGYASALAILLLLVILMLTAVNSRLASKRAFYG